MATNGRARPSRHRQTTPIGRNLGLGAANNLDHIAVLQRRAHGFQFAVDLHADGCIAHIGVHRIGKVQRHTPARQGDQLALGRKHKHLFEIHLELGVFDPVFAALAMFDHLNKVAQADLHFDLHTRRADDRCVQRSIVVRLGRRDEILKPVRHHRPDTVDDTQRAITVVFALDDDAETIDVRQGREAHRLAL